MIVTVNVQLETPHAFVAEHVTTVIPVAKDEPDAGVHVTVGAGVPVAVGFVQVAMWLSHWSMFEGHALITGAVFVVTIPVEAEEVHPPKPVTVTV